MGEVLDKTIWTSPNTVRMVTKSELESELRRGRIETRSRRIWVKDEDGIARPVVETYYAEKDAETY